MPTENTVSKSAATCSLPCSDSLAKAGKLARNTAPKNHIHEMPMSAMNTGHCCLASARLRQVSATGFQQIRNCGAAAGVGGTPCEAASPSSASARQASAAYCGP